jgi:hypothetical protein
VSAVLLVGPEWLEEVVNFIVMDSITTQLILQLNALILLLLKAQNYSIALFRLSSPYMFQPAWVILRGCTQCLAKIIKN